MPIIVNCTCIATGNGKWVVGLSNSNVLQSANGVTYTTQTPGLGMPVDNIAFGNGVFVTTGSQGSGVSADGITWTLHEIAGQATFIAMGCLFFDGAQFVTVGLPVGGDGNWVVYTSADGITWTNKGELTGGQLAADNQDVTAGCFGIGEYWLGATGGYVRGAATIAALLTATDVQPVAGFVGQTVKGLVAGNGRLVAVGTQNATASTTDGVTWGTEDSKFPALTDIQGICYDAHNGLFVAVGRNGTLSTRVNT